jgi:glycerol-1-phosphate dehydrogenase [NAD(P)+]
VSDLDTAVVDDLNDLRELVRSSLDGTTLHEIGLREVVRGRGAITSLSQVLERAGISGRSAVCLITDSTPKHYGDGDILDVVLGALRSGRPVEIVRLTPEAETPLVHADETTVASSVERVRRTAPEALVSVGSGTIVDIAKVVARELALTHVVVQTAASVNGFADDQSVLLINGVKRTTPSQWPDALVVDPWAIAEAPLDMTRSGLGDQLSMYSAAADWYLSSIVGFDASYSETVVTMMRRDVDALVTVSDELGRGDPGAVSLLTSCLTVGGLAMGVAGRTAPSSGSEHLISHVLEMHGDAHGQPSASHGSQVGAASVLAGLIWSRLRQHLRGADAKVQASNVASREQVLRAFADLDATGATAEECWRGYERKATWIHLHLDDIRRVVRNWAEHDEVLERLLRPPRFVATALARAQAPVAFGQLDPAPAPEVVRWAVTHCHLMRDRFTIVDFAQLLGIWDPSDIAAVLAEQNELAR